jgi:hypothetical protein
VRNLHRKLDRIESAIADRASSPAGGDDDLHFLISVAALGELQTTDGVPGLVGTAADWSPFFAAWRVFSSVSDAWAARGETPAADFLAGQPDVVRLRAWHMASPWHRGGRNQPTQLRDFTLHILYTLDLPLNREDSDRMAERAAMPPEVLQVFLDDPESVPFHDCEQCGVFLPVKPWQQGGPGAVTYFTACPVCGGARLGHDWFRWREQHAAAAAAARARRSVWPAAATEAEAGQQADTRATRRRTTETGRGVERDDDGWTPPEGWPVAGRPRADRFA